MNSLLSFGQISPSFTADCNVFTLPDIHKLIYALDVMPLLPNHSLENYIIEECSVSHVCTYLIS